MYEDIDIEDGPSGKFQAMIGMGPRRNALLKQTMSSAAVLTVQGENGSIISTYRRRMSDRGGHFRW